MHIIIINYHAIHLLLIILLMPGNEGDKGQKVLLLCVPSFDITHSVVMVNLKTLEPEEAFFSTTLMLKPNPDLEGSHENKKKEIDLIQELDSDDEM